MIDRQRAYSRHHAARSLVAVVPSLEVKPTETAGIPGVSRRAKQQIVKLIADARLPAIYGLRDYVEANGLMSYSMDRPQMSRRAAEYVDKILKGAVPADLPVEQPTKFELVINLKAAKRLGIDIPPSLLAIADEVIE